MTLVVEIFTTDGRSFCAKSAKLSPATRECADEVISKKPIRINRGIWPMVPRHLRTNEAAIIKGQVKIYRINVILICVVNSDTVYVLNNLFQC